jgi:hypothetical protein
MYKIAVEVLKAGCIFSKSAFREAVILFAEAVVNIGARLVALNRSPLVRVARKQK